MGVTLFGGFVEVTGVKEDAIIHTGDPEVPGEVLIIALGRSFFGLT
jgi:hypothetical protein